MMEVSSLRKIVENCEELLIGRVFFDALELAGEVTCAK